MVQDLKVFSIRKDPDDFSYQIISLPSDKYLRIEKLNQEFV